MAERFPRAALNPSAQPWVREVQRRIEKMERDALQARQRAANAGRVLDGMRGGENADGAIYRRNGVLVPVGTEDFTIYSGATADQGGQYDESGQFIQDGSFASLNVQPALVQMRSYDVLNDLYAYVRLSRKAFDVSWGSAQNVTISHDDSLIDDQAAHWAIRWEWEAPGSTYDEDGGPVRTVALGSLFDGALQVQAHFDWTHVGDAYSPGPLEVDAILLNGQEIAAVPYATHYQSGQVLLARDEDAIAGTDDTYAVTPKGLAAALAAYGGGGGGGGGSNLADAWKGEWVAP